MMSIIEKINTVFVIGIILGIIFSIVEFNFFRNSNYENLSDDFDFKEIEKKKFITENEVYYFLKE